MTKTVTAAQFQSKLLEKDVAQQVRDFMECRHWRRVRMQSIKGFGAGGSMITVGEKGMADLLYVLYLSEKEFPGLAAFCWVETKRFKGGKRHQEQNDWQTKERQRGAIVLNANDIVLFEKEYNAHFGWVHERGLAPSQQSFGLFEERF
jgi:hypothetical protein